MKVTGRRHDCPHRGKPEAGYHHDHGDGRAPRKRCRGCKGTLFTESGMWGVFTHSGGTGQYPVAEAHGLYARESTAISTTRAYTDRVVRWIPASLLGSGVVSMIITTVTSRRATVTVTLELLPGPYRPEPRPTYVITGRSTGGGYQHRTTLDQCPLTQPDGTCERTGCRGWHHAQAVTHARRILATYGNPRARRPPKSEHEKAVKRYTYGNQHRSAARRSKALVPVPDWPVQPPEPGSRDPLAGAWAEYDRLEREAKDRLTAFLESQKGE